MNFTFSMQYEPAYQKRYGKCTLCEQGIVAGEKIMLGSGFWQNRIFLRRAHLNCFMEAQLKAANDWFFKHDYVSNKLTPEKVAELNRLRSKRHYVKKIGGDHVAEKLEAIEQQIAKVKEKN